MARQVIDLTTPQPNGKMGEPTKSAWEKTNDNFAELYSISYDPSLIYGAEVEYVSGGSYRVTPGSFYIPSIDSVVTFSSAVTKSPSLPVNQYLHVYGFVNAGSVDFEAVTTAPSAPYFGAARTKSGDTSRRYLGTLKIGADGSIFNFIKVGNDCYYQASILASPFVVLSNGNQSTITLVNCSAVIPPVSRVGLFTVTNSDASARLDLYNGAGAGPVAFVNGSNSDQLRIPLNSSQQIQYTYASLPSGSSNIRVSGYSFQR